MSIPYCCEHCSQKLLLPDKALGKRVKCPRCRTVFLVREPDTTVALHSANVAGAVPVRRAVTPEASRNGLLDELVPEAKRAATSEKAVSHPDPFASHPPAPPDPFASIPDASEGNAIFGFPNTPGNPFDELLDTIPTNVSGLETSANPYESPLARSSVKRTVKRKTRRKQGGYYAPIGEVVTETYQAFFGNMSMFLSLGVKTFLAQLGFNILMGLLGVLVSLSGSPVIVLVFLPIAALTNALFVVALMVGNQTCAYNITGGRDPGGLFDFDQGHFINALFAQGTILVVSCLLAIPMSSSFSVPPNATPRDAVVPAAPSRNPVERTVSLYRFADDWDDWDDSGHGGDVEGWDSWDEPTQASDADVSSPASKAFPAAPEFPVPRPQGLPAGDEMHEQNENDAAMSPAFRRGQKVGMIIAIAYVNACLLNSLGAWMYLFIIDRESFGPVALLQAVVFFGVNFISVLIGGLLFFVAPVGLAVLSCVIAFAIHPIGGCAWTVCCVLFATFTIMPMTMCFLAVTYRLATYGELGTSRNTGVSAW